MNESERAKWFGAVLLAAVVYLLAGLIFGAMSGMASSPQMRTAWRLAAWAVSGVVFAAQIGYEQLRRRASLTTTALHASLGAALGAFALAVAANIHEFASGSSHRPLLLLSLVLWPMLVAVPAFVVALAAAASLNLVRRHA